MAIEKEIVINVKETGLEEVDKKVGKLTESTNELSKSQTKNKKSSQELVGSIDSIAPSATGAVKSFASMGKAMLALVANPLGLALTAIVAVVALLIGAFKSFTPLVDKLEQVFAGLGSAVNVIKNTFISVVTGTKSLGEAFGGLGGDINEATKRTEALIKAQQDLEDVMKSQEVTTAKNRAEINKLNVELRNRTKTDEERLAISNKIIQLENKDYLQRKAIVDAEVKQAREAIAIKAQFTKAEIKLLKETGDATKELAESRGGNYDEEFDALNKARLKAIALEDEVTVNLEKTYSRRDKIEDDRLAKIEKLESDKKAKQKEESDAEIKRREDEQKARIEAYKNEQETIKDINATQDAINEERAKKEEEDGAFKMRIIEVNFENEKRINDERIKNDELVKNAKVDIANQTLSLISEIAGRGSKIGKAIAIAQTTISGIEGVQNAFTTANKSPTTAFFPAYPYIQAGLAGAFSAVQIAKIAKGDKPTGGGSSAGGAGGSAPQAPSFNLVQGTGRNQIAESLQNQAPIKSYVVAKDVTTGQSLDRNIIESASL